MVTIIVSIIIVVIIIVTVIIIAIIIVTIIIIILIIIIIIIMGTYTVLAETPDMCKYIHIHVRAVPNSFSQKPTFRHAFCRAFVVLRTPETMLGHIMVFVFMIHTRAPSEEHIMGLGALCSGKT